MVSRKTVLALSIMASILAHGGFIAASPRFVVMGGDIPAHLAVNRLQVRILDETDLQRFEPRTGPEVRELATRPGTIADLVRAETERISPSESSLDKRVEVPNLSERLIREALPSEAGDRAAPGLQEHVDAKILEISQSAARQEIQISRRLVAPSVNRILAEGENPLLRGTGTAIGDEVLIIDPLRFGTVAGAAPVGASDAVAGSPAAGLPRPSREQTEESSFDEVLRDLPELPIERVVARAPIVQAIERDKQYDYIDDLVVMELETYVPQGAREGFFRLRIAPKEGQTIEPLPKDVTFIIDASNSILQRKLDQTVQGVRRSIAELRPEDRFNVVIFRDTPTLFQPGLTYATPDRKAAAEQFLKGQQARGETDVYQGIQPVINEPTREGIPGIVMVMTDGKPTKGIRDSRTIINALTDENNNRHSIYAFAGGRNVNQHLLDLLAYRNKGEAMVAPQVEEMGRALPQFFSRLNDPILVDCDADFGRIDEADIFPKQIPDFFRGQAVTIYGKFDPQQNREFAMRLKGLAGPRQKEVVFRAELATAGNGSPEIARNWAFRKVYHLIGEVTRVGETPELLAEIRSLCRQYNIRTSYDQ